MISTVERLDLHFVADVLEAERAEQAATVQRLDAVIKQQAERIALLEQSASRTQADLVEARTKAKAMRLIEDWRDSELAESLCDGVGLLLEDYQDDESGRLTYVLIGAGVDARHIVDGDWLPTKVFTTKLADDGERVQLKFELDLSSLWYDVEIV